MSRRLVVAVDCDDVLVHATEHLVDSYNRAYGTSVTLAHAHQSKNSEWQADRQEVFRRIVRIQQSKSYAAIAPPSQTVDAVRRIARSNELHLITARLDHVMPVTTRMIETYFPGCFTSVEHVGPDRSKGEVCRTIGAEIMIDDNYRHLESASAGGVKLLIWFGDYPWQQKVDGAGLNVVRCIDWLQAERAIREYAE